MRQPDPFENADLNRLRLFLYLLPVIGFFPALWTLYQGQSSRQERNLSRQVVTLALVWLAGYVLLGLGTQASESLELPLLITNSLWTSGYFLVHLWMMARLWQRKSLRLPLFDRLSDRQP